MAANTTLPSALVAGGIAAALAPAAHAQTAGPLEEVVVTASIIETPLRQLGTAVSVIDAEELELRGQHSIADVLRTQPGIGVSNSGGPGKETSLRIRGEEGYRTLLIIDGVKAVDPTGTQVGPSFSSLLATGDMERVEVLRGPQGFMYGADAGGVVNIMTRTGAGELDGRIGLEYGKFDTRQLDASVSGGSDTGDFYVAVSDLETDGFNARTNDTVLMDDDGAENTTLHAKVGWNAADDLRLQLVARDIDASTMFDNCFSPTTFQTVHDCVATNDQTTYKLSADWTPGAFRHSFGYSNVDIARDSFAEGTSSFFSAGELSRLEYTGSFMPSPAATLVYGVDLQTEKITSGAGAERDQDAYYFEYQGNFGDRFYLSAGARYDDNEDFGSHTSTRVSAAFVQDMGTGSTLKYRASLGTGFRAPSLFEIDYNRGPFAFPPASDVSLVEESSAGYDVGIEYATEYGLRLELTWFDQDIEDEIFFDLAGFSGYLQSTGQSNSNGLEFAARAPVGDHVEFLANWTHNRTEDSTNAQRLRRPKTLANLGLIYRGVDDRLRMIANYRISRDAIDIGNVPLDDYQVLDLSLAYRINDTLELHGRVENAADEKFREIIGFNTAGRTAYAGVRLRF